MKLFKNQCDLLKGELNFVQSKNEALEKDNIFLVYEVFDKPLDEHEMALQEFIINGFNRFKLTPMIYGVSRRKVEGLGYSQKSFNLRFEILSKLTNPSSSSSSQKGIDSYFVHAAENAKIMNRSEPKVVESRILKKLEPKTLKSKIPKKP